MNCYFVTPTLKDQLRRLAESAGNLSVHRKDLSLSAGDLGRASSMLSNTEGIWLLNIHDIFPIQKLLTNVHC